MIRVRMVVASLLTLAATPVLALPIAGHNTFQVKCPTFFDLQTDPFVHPGVFPSPHLHRWYGVLADQNFNVKTVADLSNADPAVGFIENVPGGGPSLIRDPGYEPQVGSCPTYGYWGIYAVPADKTNGALGTSFRYYNDPNTTPPSYATFTWAAPVGVKVYPPPYGEIAVVGNAMAMSEAEQDNAHVYWTCGSLTTNGVLAGARSPQDCTIASIPSATQIVDAGGNIWTLPSLTSPGNVIYRNGAATTAEGDHLQVLYSGGVIYAQNNEGWYQWSSGWTFIGTTAPASAGPPPTEFSDNGIVTAVVVGPDCWDGTHAYAGPNPGPGQGFDQPMGIDKSHFSYSSAGACPAGSVMTAQLIVAFHFTDLRTKDVMINPFNPDRTLALSFSSGPYYTFHSDFGIEENADLAFQVSGCLNNQEYYGEGIGPPPSGYYSRLANGGVTNCSNGPQIPRCPAPSSGISANGALIDPNGGLAICKDQDEPQ